MRSQKSPEPDILRATSAQPRKANTLGVICLTFFLLFSFLFDFFFFFLRACDVREFSRFMCAVFDLDATHGKKIFTPFEICCGNYSCLF